MSQISSSKKVRSSWKVSESSRIYPSEESIRDLKPALPEKFSPSKNTPRGSKIFTASKEKLQLLRGDRSPRDSSLTPSKREGPGLLNHFSLKESVPLIESPQRVRTEHLPDLRPQESLVLQHLECDTPVAKRRGAREVNYELLKSQQEFNLRAIHQIRVDFIAFKTQVWAELVAQKENIGKIAADLANRIDQNRLEQGRFAVTTTQCVQ